MRTLPTPPHLAGVTELVQEEDDFLTLRLGCPCGCGRFRLERACLSAAEKAEFAAWKEREARTRNGYFIRLRRNGKGLLETMRKRGLFGKWKPLEPYLPPLPRFVGVHEVRGICEDCGRGYTLFDSRLHGDEACRGAFPPGAMTWQHGWEEIPVPEGTVELRVGLWFRTDQEDAAKLFPGEPDWANTFADFVLSAIGEGGLRTDLYGWLDEG